MCNMSITGLCQLLGTPSYTLKERAKSIQPEILQVNSAHVLWHYIREYLKTVSLTPSVLEKRIKNV